MRLVKTALGMAIMLFPLQQAQAGPQETFGDWHISCDNYQNCSASVSIDLDPADLIVPDYQLTIARGAYETFWELSLTVFAAQPNLESALVFNIEDKKTPLNGPNQIAAFDALNTYFVIGDPAQQLMDQLVPASYVTIDFQDNDQIKQVIEFSLSGLSTALLWIDEHQQRLGAERVAGPPPANKTQVTDRMPAPLPQSIVDRRTTDSSCDDIADLPHGDNIMSHRVSATHTLHLLPCWAGAYNFGYIAFVDDGERARQHYFAAFGETLGWSGTNALVNPYFEDNNGLLFDLNKSRGLGDCGTAGIWRWDNWGFKLLEYSAKRTCDTPDKPFDFPVIYRAEDFRFPQDRR